MPNRRKSKKELMEKVEKLEKRFLRSEKTERKARLRTRIFALNKKIQEMPDDE